MARGREERSTGSTGDWKEREKKESGGLKERAKTGEREKRE